MAALYTKAGLEALWALAGGDAADADVASAVALAESKGDPDALDNTSSPGQPNYKPPSGNASPEFSVGLWQINWLAHPNYDVSELPNPLYNATAAVEISNGGADFSAWSTYTSGAYQQYLVGGVGLEAGGGGLGVLKDFATDAKAYGGWNDLRQVFNQGVVENLKYAQTSLSAAVRVLAADGKVGG